jgi:flagellar FliL protein
LSEKLLPDEEDPPKGRKLGLILGVVAALLLGGGGFYAAYSGLVGGSVADSKVEKPAKGVDGVTHGGQNALSKTAFVPLDPIIVSLANNATSRYLKFDAELEVDPAFKDEVTKLLPRVLDVLNGYLRAVDSRDIEDPAAMARLRAQMLWRIQVVTGAGRVKDLLITGFVLN